METFIPVQGDGDGSFDEIIMVEGKSSSSILDVLSIVLGVRCEKGGVMDDSYISGLSNSKDGVSI